ncbi:DUF862-domain-containing protein [Auricularia subglabra TFB-10046 SS5]|uniref:DUF862-domain-containing protein n=1 Tax=Auricularia subglabra (strain TFB-10046 / SS5) TaxID=717982 RepID=J0D2D8_AURST|nr:DUF862-domain-containing protein [Auricularia subglabra TFB-10046 SS5]
MSKVELYVYDLSNGLARQMSRQLTGRQIDGIWHTSVVVYNKEYFYGQGINTTPPGRSHHGQPLQVLNMGETAIDEGTFDEYLAEMSDLYTADKYHLLEFNCNNFTNDVVGFLTGGSIPDWIKDLPSDFLSTPFGAALRPTIDAMYRRPAPGAAAAPPAQAGMPDTALAASFLQAVAAQAAGGSAQPHAPASAVETVAGPLQVSTNWASFANILATHRAVAVFFTSPTCGPCKTIEPLFDELAEAKQNPGTAFVKVDMSVGRSYEIAQRFNIRATPTFMFFVDGKKTMEFKGPNQPELRTQVDLLMYTAFPAHLHMSLHLPHIRAMSTNSILFSQVPALDAALAKFLTFVDAAPSSPNFNKSAIKTTLSTTFVPFLKKRFATPNSKAAIPSAVVGQWASASITLTSALPAKELFPLADFWRLAVQDTTVATYLTADPSVLEGLFSRATDTLDEPDARNLSLTTLRLATNALAPDVLGRRLLTPATALLVPALLHSDARVRAAAASLAFNGAVLFARPLMAWARAGTRGVPPGGRRDAEWEMALTSALVEALRSDQSEDVVHRLAAALAMLVHLSPHFIEQGRPLLDVLGARRALLATVAEGGCVKKPEIKALVTEVAEELCPDT